MTLQTTTDPNEPQTNQPPPSEQERAEQMVARNYRHNFLVNAMDGATYWLGYSFIAPAIILPLFLSHFTSSPLIIGLIPFMNTAGFLLPQLFTSNFVERAPIKKFFPVNLGLFLERVPVMLFAPITLFFAVDRPQLALVLFLLVYFWYTFGAGLIIVGWQDMIAKIIPVHHRGRFFGITNFAGNATGVLGAVAVPVILTRFDFPNGFVIAFAAAALFIFLSWVFLAQTREPAVHNNKPRVSQTEYMRSLPRVIRRDPNFLRYLIFQITAALALMGGGFLIVYVAQNWNLPDSQASGYIIAMQLGTALLNPLFGVLADRKGHKLILEITALLTAISFLLPAIAPNPLWFYPIFFLRGAAFAGAMLSGISIVMEFCQPQDRPTYFGLANTIPGIASAVAPLIGGLLAQVVSYPFVFVVSAVLGLVSFVVLHWTVNEPRHQPKASALTGVAD